MEKFFWLNQKKQCIQESLCYSKLASQCKKKKIPYDHVRTWTTSKTVQMIFVLRLTKSKTVITLSVHKTSHVQKLRVGTQPKGMLPIEPVSLFLSHAFIERM